MISGYCLICKKPIPYGELYSLSIEGKKHLRCTDYLTEMEQKIKDSKDIDESQSNTSK